MVLWGPIAINEDTSLVLWGPTAINDDIILVLSGHTAINDDIIPVLWGPTTINDDIILVLSGTQPSMMSMHKRARLNKAVLFKTVWWLLFLLHDVVRSIPWAGETQANCVLPYIILVIPRVHASNLHASVCACVCLRVGVFVLSGLPLSAGIQYNTMVECAPRVMVVIFIRVLST